MTKSKILNRETMIRKSFLLILAICFVPYLATAQFSGGNGTENNPYIITTAAQLAQLATFVNDANAEYNDKHYKLGNNIDLSNYGENFNDGKGWIPIGNFRGVFDGNNYVVANLFINADISNAGLFGRVENGTVKNLGVENVSISGNINGNIGAVAGNVTGSSVDNCYSTGTITVTGSNGGTGGIVGALWSGNHVSGIVNCYSTVDVSAVDVSAAGNAWIGGIVGQVSRCDVFNCYSTGAVSADRGYIGGIVGYLYCSGVGIATISNCYSTGAVSATGSDGSSYVGGIVGLARSEYEYEVLQVLNCYSISPLSNNSTYSIPRTGGLVGYSYSRHFSGGTAGDIAIRDCAALNPSIYCTAAGGYTRISWGATPMNNIAYDNMIPPDHGPGFIPHSGINGKDISADEIYADGTLGGRFGNRAGWTTENGKLPGLFGNTVDIPDYILEDLSIKGLTTSQASLYPNPAKDNIFVECDANSTIQIYDMLGKEVLSQLGNGKTAIDIKHLPKGVYNVNVISNGRIVGNNKVVKQ